MQNNDYLESVYNELEVLTKTREHGRGYWNEKQETTDWIVIIKDGDFLDNTIKNVIEQESRKFNGDIWELAEKLFALFCKKNGILPSSVSTFAVLVLYVFYATKPLDLSVV